MPARHAKPFEDETDGKEHSERQNQEQVIGSNQNNRAMNLSSTRRKENLRTGSARFHFIGFKSHTAFWVDNKHNGSDETTSWQKDNNLLTRTQREGTFFIGVEGGGEKVGGGIWGFLGLLSLLKSWPSSLD